MSNPPKPSNYDLFRQADFNRPEHYPLDQSVSPELYRPLATWMGRLLLPKPEERDKVKGAWLELHHAGAEYQHLVGQVVYLRWHNLAEVMSRVWSAARDVYLSEEAKQSLAEGLVHPTRLDHWRLVTSLESLAGARPHNDVIVMLREPVEVVESPEQDEPASLYISREPIQITGRYYALVKFIAPVQSGGDLFRVVHFNRASRRFDGPEETVHLPETIIDTEALYRSTSHGIEQDPLNETGWYIAGAKNPAGTFVAQALAPRALLNLQPDQIITGRKAAVNFIKKQAWHETTERKGQINTVLLTTEGDEKAALDSWREGDQALLVNTYGGIGNGREPYPYPGGYYFGHFSYGRARVIREPLADALIFDLEYFQVFSSNGDGLVPGILHWTRYVGDRQFGFLGYRPVCDILLKLDCFTVPYAFAHRSISALERMSVFLEFVLHLYRIGGGSGGVYFGVANNCTQDSNQALYAAVKDLDVAFKDHPLVQDMLNRHPEEAERFDRLLTLGHDLRKTLLPTGTVRADWRYNFQLFEVSLNENGWMNILRALMTWRAMTPHWASTAVTTVFLAHGATAWVLRSNQVGNYDPEMVPKAIDP
ncbi:MAG: hypothetical protein KDJ65_20595 [Anaerolineae bacterium]|nr:hypothetical protein [Anaerolineae bacterium]